jgi:hypothetical protein
MVGARHVELVLMQIINTLKQCAYEVLFGSTDRESVKDTGPPLWSSGQSSWLQIQGSVFDSQHYQISREVVGLERGPLSLVSTTEELLARKSSGSGLENREYGRRDVTLTT